MEQGTEADGRDGKTAGWAAREELFEKKGFPFRLNDAIMKSSLS
jgi:hypothetical protein